MSCDVWDSQISVSPHYLSSLLHNSITEVQKKPFYKKDLLAIRRMSLNQKVECISLLALSRPGINVCLFLLMLSMSNITNATKENQQRLDFCVCQLWRRVCDLMKYILNTLQATQCQMSLRSTPNVVWVTVGRLAGFRCTGSKPAQHTAGAIHWFYRFTL